MTKAFEIAGTGLETQQRALDIIANNIANINTPGYKRTDVQFSELIAHQVNGSPLAAAIGPAEQVAGVVARGHVDFNRQGQVEQTGNAMDLAIDGRGFIELMGPGGQSLLWRGGNLAISETGQLTAGNGMMLRANITIPLDAADLRIDGDGQVSARNSAGEVEHLGVINLVRLEDTTALERLDGGLYRVENGSHLMDAVPGEDGAGRLIQGAIERSNVELNDEMVRLMVIQRAYAANAQIVQAADQLMSIANNLRR